MIKKVYFAGAIRGGQEDIQLYALLITHIKKYAQVLTEHIGDDALLKAQRARLTKEKDIYDEDTKLIDQADLVIAEVTQPSLGVGYELGYAEGHKKPIHCLYRTTPGKKLSAMIRGNSSFHVYDYSTIEEAYEHLDNILTRPS